MTSMQQFIETALVGGWQPTDRDFRIIGFYERYFEYQPLSTLPGRSAAIRIMVYADSTELRGSAHPRWSIAT